MHSIAVAWIYSLTQSVAKAPVIHCIVILHVVVASPVPLPGHYGALSQTADDEQRQDGEADNARDYRNDHRLGSH